MNVRDAPFAIDVVEAEKHKIDGENAIRPLFQDKRFDHCAGGKV